MVNRDNICLLADFIESHSELPFDMKKALVPDICGTAGCIAGFGAALWPVSFDSRPFFDTRKIAALLGLEKEEEKRKLFYPADDFMVGDEFVCHKWASNEDINDYDSITRRGAVATLRRLASTGQVEWKKEEQLPDSPDTNTEASL